MKTKSWFAEQVILELQNDWPQIDLKLDERMIYVRLDASVNELATKNYFENWRLSGAGLDEQFITSFDVTVQDRPNSLPSFFTIPANYAALPRNGGIQSVYPKKWKDEYQSPVAIITFEDLRRYSSNPAFCMQGRLYGYPKGTMFEFGTCDVTKKYGSDFGIRLAIRDSSQIAQDQPYGIPADKEQAVISACVAWFRMRRHEPTDVVRDHNDKP